ncbi:MAG: OmpA family protein [Sulfuricurvum sp.]|uniref:OmpA family protein n=1 Tax=Sulfuricurvum sp. TaxID=2025608 RepID=UPI0026125085|nr:OmpA family protein [Sulfuricurvum sp.]MDD5159863.1 OmpA family protein [Sulfuricurvum sp.]
MQRKIVIGLISIVLGWGSLFADVSEMIFYPQSDFSEGILHFNYQGSKNKNYGFMFDRGFDPTRLVYVRPDNNTIEKLKDGTVKLSFANTDRYSYIQRAFKDDFLVSENNGVYKILLSGGDCKGSPDCVTAENILTVNVPKGFGVRKYEGLDQDLKPLKNSKWQIKGNVFTMTARDVKGACVMMELEKLKPGQVVTPVAVTNPIIPQPSAAVAVLKVPDPSPIVNVPEPVTVVMAEAPVPAVTAPIVKAAAADIVVATAPMVKSPEAETSVFATPIAKAPAAPVLKPIASAAPVTKLIAPKIDLPAQSAVAPKPVVERPSTPELAPYFRNFQLFQSRIVALNEDGKDRLREWAKLFKSSGYKTIIINSYTDNIPPQRLKALYATNEILSEARGKMVAEFLVTQGIDPKIITVNGMGDADPIAPNETEEGRSKNRRVEFILAR